MSGADNPTPTRRVAERLAVDFAGEAVPTLERYRTGLCHWVYRCRTHSGRTFVLRVARPQNRALVEGGMAISRKLSERDVPVARVLDGNASRETRFPWMVVEHLAGRDLEHVYDALDATPAQRRRCDFYTALYAFVFLSEQGLAFNEGEATVDANQVESLRAAVRWWLD